MFIIILIMLFVVGKNKHYFLFPTACFLFSLYFYIIFILKHFEKCILNHNFETQPGLTSRSGI